MHEGISSATMEVRDNEEQAPAKGAIARSWPHLPDETGRHAVPGARVPAGSAVSVSAVAAEILLERADWMENALSELPTQPHQGDWKKNVLISQARRDAEFAMATRLQGLQPGRATITVSERTGTSIRMFGLRAASHDGFEAACRHWIEMAREKVARDATQDPRPASPRGSLPGR